MRAAGFYEHGGIDNIRVIDDLPIPEPRAGEVRVRVRAAALNRLDLWVLAGWKGLELPKPHIACADGAGDIDALGDGVTHVQVGDRVGINPTVIDPQALLLTGSEQFTLGSPIMGEHAPGVAAEYSVIPARNVIKLPDHVDYAESAAAGLVYVTAWHSLIGRGGLRAGESVLIVGAGGGVNTASIQIAKHAGCMVYVVGSSTEKCQQARELGADVTIDRSSVESWSRELHKLTDKQGVDVVVDNVGQATLPDSLRAVKRGGRILIVGNTSGFDARIDTRFIFGKHISIIGSSMGTTHDFQTVMGQVFAGRLKPVIGARYPLDQAQDAYRALEAGDVFGKVVLEL